MVDKIMVEKLHKNMSLKLSASASYTASEKK
jgi:hypothetical protein